MEGINMRDLQVYTDMCLKEVTDAGIEYGKIEEFIVNTRAINRYGRCTRKPGGTFVIQISKYLLDERVPVNELKNTIIHEILHTCKDCFNHGNAWKNEADIMNRKYGYNISRTGSCSDFVMVVEEEHPYKYFIKCKECGKVYKKRRKCNLIEHPGWYRCGRCGGKLEAV